MIESELFGYERGAFTGADREGKEGLLQMADGGTVFLDEIGEMPLAMQPKLMRAIQDREILPSRWESNKENRCAISGCDEY